jgi:hypothetical protein
MAIHGRSGQSQGPRVKVSGGGRVEFFDDASYLGGLFDDRPALVSLNHRLHIRHLVTRDDHEAA